MVGSSATPGSGTIILIFLVISLSPRPSETELVDLELPVPVRPGSQLFWVKQLLAGSREVPMEPLRLITDLPPNHRDGLGIKPSKRSSPYGCQYFRQITDET